MWKFLIICVFTAQLSVRASVIQPLRNVTLKFVSYNCNSNSSKDIICSLEKLSSSTEQVVVSSTTIDTEALKSTACFRIEIVGNEDYPEYFPKNIGKFIDGVTNFVYKNTSLKSICRDDFKHMSTKLRSLEISSHKIEEIPYDTFYDITELSYLNIRGNRIKSLAPNLFFESQNLQALVMDWNYITELHSDHFKKCPIFEILNMEFNKITSLQEDLFQNNPNMTKIYMTYNRIKNIFVDFNRFEFLDVADFTHNKGNCDIIYSKTKRDYYDKHTLENMINRVPEFQKKIEELCRIES